MTKKTANIMQKYIDKMNDVFYMYQNNFIDRKAYIDRITKNYQKFSDMINTMYQYGLISTADFNEVKPCKVWFEYLDK